jgi:ribulose-5-phosphate 4-epimerase/fuculose-1-phosphate aldolase
MTTKETLQDLVIGNRILARQNVVDAFGHLSVRHPDRSDRFFMARSKSPASIEIDDILEFDLECNPLDQKERPMYAERAIHGSIYRRRPDVISVCHNHAPATIPFGVTDVRLRPIYHMAAGTGQNVVVWDIAQEFGETSMLVTSAAQGDSLAKALSDSNVILMRGHGAVVVGSALRETVFRSVYLQKNAELLSIALGFGRVHYLSDCEIAEADKINASALAQDRAWAEWSSELRTNAHY